MVNSVWTGAFLMPEKNLIMNEKRKDMDYETFKRIKKGNGKALEALIDAHLKKLGSSASS